LIDDISNLARLDRVDFEINKEWISLNDLGGSPPLASSTKPRKVSGQLPIVKTGPEIIWT
jgi:hypothetical protein